MSPNKVVWELGDFSKIAETFRDTSEANVHSLNIVPGTRILDLGCGDGSTAIPAAILGADVLGVDIASIMVAAGSKRAVDAGVSSRCKFQEGDASSLTGLEDNQFDVVRSFFGAMFSPKPFETAKEMVRVARKPGGRIVMGNWVLGSPTFTWRLSEIMGKYTPPPPEGSVSPLTWGLQADVIERFGAAGVPKDKIKFEERVLEFKSMGTTLESLALFRQYAAPFILGFRAAEAAGRAAELQEELEACFKEFNRSSDPKSVLIPSTYLFVDVEL